MLESTVSTSNHTNHDFYGILESEILTEAMGVKEGFWECAGLRWSAGTGLTPKKGEAGEDEWH